MTGWRVIKTLSPFHRLTKRSPEYAQGYRAGTKAAVTWLMNAAEERGKNARAVLNRAAADMAREAKDIAWDGQAEGDEGPMLDALRDGASIDRCPFCRGAAEYILGSGVRCISCGAHVPCRGDELWKWNRRATDMKDG